VGDVVVAIMSEKDGSLDSGCCSMNQDSMAVVYEATKEGSFGSKRVIPLQGCVFHFSFRVKVNQYSFQERDSGDGVRDG